MLRALWGKYPTASSLHDFELDSCLTYHQFLFLNRHMSFARTKEEEEEESDEEQDDDPSPDEDQTQCDECQHTESDDSEGYDRVDRTHDTHRKRIVITNIANAACAAAYNPHQHLGLDEGTRSTKHWDKVRIRFKASVHSGSLVDMLNDCCTNYCVWFEEQSWHSKKFEGEEINSIKSRLLRAASCLIEKGMDPRIGKSTSAYCISLDRGYGNVAAQDALWAEAGVYSNSMVQTNRCGMPRELISQVQVDLHACDKDCDHKLSAHGCRKFMWTVVHKKMTLS